MRAVLSCLVIVVIAACDRGTKRRVEPTQSKSAHDSMKTRGAPCYDGMPKRQTETSPARESGRAGSFDGRDAQVRREPCPDAGAP